MKTDLLLFLIFSLLLSFSSGEQCGRQANGALCPNGLCCGEYGWCGTTELYCDPSAGCQSQCTPAPYSPPPPPPTGSLSDIISRDQYYKMLLHTNDSPAKGFYTYDAFITAAKSFPSFGTTGDLTTRKREIAAFFGQTSHQTNGGWPAAKEPYTWGYYYIEQAPDPGRPLCDPNRVQWPCAPGQLYHGRGPIMLSWNYNYGPCGRDIGVDLLHNPSIASKDSVISFKTAIWFWMTPQAPKPSCHDVITNQWQPSNADTKAGRLPGYGMTGNIITGGECYPGDDPNRIGFYKRYCDEIFGVDPGSNLECPSQRPFTQGSNVFLDAAI